MTEPVITVKGNTLIIELDVSKEAVKMAPLSKSGKTNLLASISQKVKVRDDLTATLGLNLMVKKA